MIVEQLMAVLFVIVEWIGGKLGAVLSIDSTAFQAVLDYLRLAIQHGAGLLFFFIPRQTFLSCVDIIFVTLSLRSSHRTIMYFLRKIPFLGIQ